MMNMFGGGSPSYVATMPIMHQFARELGMEVDELYEVLMDVAEKVDMERR